MLTCIYLFSVSSTCGDGVLVLPWSQSHLYSVDKKCVKGFTVNQLERKEVLFSTFSVLKFAHLSIFTAGFRQFCTLPILKMIHAIC